MIRYLAAAGIKGSPANLRWLDSMGCCCRAIKVRVRWACSPSYDVLVATRDVLRRL